MSDVSKAFGDTRVLRGISLSIAHGEFVTLLGPSGCGKTTLLRIIAGFETVDAGSVTLNGRDLLSLPANHRPVNTVFQSYALFPHLSVFENVAFGLRARKTPGGEVSQRVAQGLGMLQLEELAARRPHQLSGGQRQRVALARALVNEPQVLLLDEPMSALDAKLRAQVQMELRRLQRRLGTTFVLVTHDQDEAMTVSDRVMVMNGGQIEQAGTPEEVYERPVSRFVAEFLGAANLIAGRRIGDGVETPLGVLRTRHAPAWDTGTLAIRPERVEVCTTPTGENMVGASLREVVYRGDHLELFFDLPLRVRTPATHSYAVGERLWLRLPAEHLEVLRD